MALVQGTTHDFQDRSCYVDFPQTERRNHTVNGGSTARQADSCDNESVYNKVLWGRKATDNNRIHLQTDFKEKEHLALDKCSNCPTF